MTKIKSMTESLGKASTQMVPDEAICNCLADAGIVNCFTRVSAEQGIASFWRGNLANVVRYFPTQAFNFAFKDTIKNMFPKYNPRTDFWKFFATNMASGDPSLPKIHPKSILSTL